MNKILLLLISLFFITQVFSEEITSEQAKKVALTFLNNNNTGSFKKSITLNYIGDLPNNTFNKSGLGKKSNVLNGGEDSNKYVYVFEINNSGFIVISGDDAAMPILGYSYNNTLDLNNLPSNFVKWIEGYKQQIKYIKSNKISQTKEVKALWSGEISLAKTLSSVSPLVSAKWNQSPFVNDMCPYDSEKEERTLTGCPATAMAQIMRYWEYPKQGTGFHSYQDDNYGMLSANFSSTIYDWANMPNEVVSANNAVATLMYHCGVAVEMNYGVEGSGSYVIISQSPTKEQSCEYAFKTYFGYDDSTLRGLERVNYTDGEWINILKKELDEKRPVQYAGYGEGGHTFVFDGYDNNDFFHVNWGWGGYADGYYLIDNLVPGIGGAGSGAGNYNSGQQALVGIKPPVENENGLEEGETIVEVYEDVTADKSIIYYGEEFIIHTNIVNDGDFDFDGDFAAGVFDEDDMFIDFVEIKLDYNLSSGYVYEDGIDFVTDGLLSMLPGSYYINILYKSTNEEWSIMESYDSSIDDYVYIDVVNDNDIQLISEINVLTSQIITNGELSVEASILNNSNSTFNGMFYMSLYDFNGEFIEEIGQTATGELESGYYYEDVYFTTSNLDVAPGTYLLALTHQSNDGEEELTGSIPGYVNPIEIIVKREPSVFDIYEDNNDIENAKALNVSFDGNVASVNTIGSNIHSSLDVDFYSIDLREGYTYDINARVQDEYSSDDNRKYTVDVLFAYSVDGENWSDLYDDVMLDNIAFNGGKMYFAIAPYFAGYEGDYMLDLKITSNQYLSIDKDNSINVSVYPNPFANKFNVKNKNNSVIDFVNVYDVQGRLIFTDNSTQKIKNIDLSDYSNGVYMLEIKSEDKTTIKQIIKND